MKVLTARALGFCFGVRDALATALADPDPASATIWGELVHNEEVLEQLAARGFGRTPEHDREVLPPTRRVLITAHGISDRERRRLRQAGKEIVDTTCPLVTRAHEAALRLAAGGWHVLVIGKPGHVEVRGLCGDLTDHEVVPDVASVRRYPSHKLGIVCQTTFPLADVTAIVRAIGAHNPQAEVRVEDTVCEPTKQRIQAVTELARRVPVVVVVGGRHSNNTAQLVRLARAAGARAHHVSGPDALDPAWFAGCTSVGLTAGTSTPDRTIAAVREALEAI